MELSPARIYINEIVEKENPRIIKMLRTKGYIYPTYLHFLKKYGKDFRLSKKELDIMDIGLNNQCFSNASQLYRNNLEIYRYVEGIAQKEHMDGFVKHAWVIDQKNEVIDPTWIDPGINYFGVIMPYAALWYGSKNNLILPLYNNSVIRKGLFEMNPCEICEGKNNITNKKGISYECVCQYFIHYDYEGN